MEGWQRLPHSLSVLFVCVVSSVAAAAAAAPISSEEEPSSCDAYVEEYLVDFAEENADVDPTTLRELLVELDERCPTSYTSETGTAQLNNDDPGPGDIRIDEIEEIIPGLDLGDVEPACEGHGGPNFFNWDWNLQISSDLSVGVTDPSANGEWAVYDEPSQWSEGKYKTGLGSAVLLGSSRLPTSQAEFLGVVFSGWGTTGAHCADVVGAEICSPTSWPNFQSEQLVPALEGIDLHLTADGFIENPACQD